MYEETQKIADQIVELYKAEKFETAKSIAVENLPSENFFTGKLPTRDVKVIMNWIYNGAVEFDEYDFD